MILKGFEGKMFFSADEIFEWSIEEFWKKLGIKINRGNK
jgi:hypothetical protein